MNIEEIAHKLMDIREHRMTGFIMSGQLREELGFDGYGEALRRRWILPDEQGSGMVTLTNHLGTIAEMREMASAYAASNVTFDALLGEAGPAQPGAGDDEDEADWQAFQPKLQKWVSTDASFGRHASAEHGADTPENRAKTFQKNAASLRSRFLQHRGKRRPVSTGESAVLAQSHAFRNKPGINEIATMGLGQTSDHSTPVTGVGQSQPAPASTQSTQQPASRPGAAPVTVGSDVRIVQDGKVYAGKVARVKTDGKYEISFGTERPNVTKDYDQTELQAVTDATQPRQ